MEPSNMHPKTKLVVRILTPVVITFLILAVIIGILSRSLMVTAQEPQGKDLPPHPLGKETPAMFGLNPDQIQPLNSSFDLEVVKKTDVVSVPSGTPITFTISITNHGPDPVSHILFYDDFPPQMQNVTYMFSAEAISNGLAKPTWLLTNTLPINGHVAVTVTGILTSSPDVTVKNTAIANAFNATGELTSANNSSEVSVDIAGYNLFQLTYLPVIFKYPLPEKILAYYENFDSSTWSEFNQNGCQTENSNSQYWVNLDSNRTCLPPAPSTNKPESPYRQYGEFEVDGYVSGEYKEDDHWYGIFINGQGGDEYYLFRIKPNQDSCGSGGDWELIRRSDSNNTLASGDCDSAIYRGYGGVGATNTLKIRHKGSQISVYVNDTLLKTVTDTELSGTGTGVYARSEGNQAIIKFDNFKVYRFP